MKILVINGPNLNLLGKRDPSKYGKFTLDEINKQLNKLGKSMNVSLEFFQSNHEGAIIDFLQKTSSQKADGVLINPAALVRYGYSLRQALIDLGKPVVEIHMSDINKTGVNKKVNILEDIRIGQVTGLKEKSYHEGLKKLISYLGK
ncbi:type II 3-dehydroquinate dehydratase [Candidatus Gottesmanbacteria bacterium]|nr:type II 3-dehydroquinate dehydratase [Candidatus Gottesmanbacteria bacterium]